MNRKLRGFAWLVVAVSIIGAFWTGVDQIWGTVFFLGNAAYTALRVTAPEGHSQPLSSRRIVTWFAGLTMLLGLVLWNLRYW